MEIKNLVTIIKIGACGFIVGLFWGAYYYIISLYKPNLSDSILSVISFLSFWTFPQAPKRFYFPEDITYHLYGALGNAVTYMVVGTVVIAIKALIANKAQSTKNKQCNSERQQ